MNKKEGGEEVLKREKEETLQTNMIRCWKNEEEKQDREKKGGRKKIKNNSLLRLKSLSFFSLIKGRSHMKAT